MEAGTLPDKVTISHRGAKYEIGRGKRFYGIWVAGAPESDPIDRWPETREGWEQAWGRFVAIEKPETIAAVQTPRSGFKGAKGFKMPRMTVPASLRPRGRRPVWIAAGAGLLGLGVLLGLIGLFPGYVGAQSLAGQAEQLVPHLLYLLTWAVSAAGVASGLRARSGGARIGALLGIGLSAVTFGLFFADLGQVIAYGGLGTGLVLSLLGWLACAAGSVVALIAPSRATAAAGSTGPGSTGPGDPAGRGGPSRPRATDAGPVTLLLLAAIGTVAAFVPSWDSYTLSQASTGASQTVTAGNAFASPAPVIAGNVAVIVAVIGVAVLAALWRPARHGAALLAGAILPLAAQAISALIQAGEPATPAMFGISQSQAQAAGLTISSGLTPIFWVYCVFVVSLLISCAWMLTAPQYHAMPAAPPYPAPGHVPPAQSATAGEAGESGAEAGESGASAGDNKASDGGDRDGGEDHEESTYA
jgi:hypothetical protein